MLPIPENDNWLAQLIEEYLELSRRPKFDFKAWLESQPTDQQDAIRHAITDLKRVKSVLSQNREIQVIHSIENTPRYVDFQFIQSGGMGSVFQAWDKRLQRQVAIKVPHRRMNRKHFAEFLEEARILASLNHPNCIPLYDFGKLHNNLAFISMKLLPTNDKKSIDFGQHVEDMHINRDGQSLDFPKLLQAFICVCNAVQHAHNQGILHRDIKPANILMPDSEVYLVDWGLGVFLGSGSSQTADSVAGTRQYMSPEQAEGKSPSVKTDIFGLGGILAYLLTGRPVYCGTTEELNRQAISADTREIFLALDRVKQRELKQLAKECLAKEPDDRPTLQEIITRVQQFLTAAQDAKIENARIVERNKRRWLFGIASVVMLMMLFLGLYIRQENRNQARIELQEVEKFQVEYNTAQRAEFTGSFLAAEQWYRNNRDHRRLTAENRWDLRLRMIRLSRFLGNWNTAQAETAELANAQVSPEFVGRIRLEQAIELIDLGMRELSNIPNQPVSRILESDRNAETLLNEVANDSLISAADRHFARGLLADNSTTAIKEYRSALAQEPFHPYAGPYLLMTCMIAGRHEDAKDQANLWAVACPNDPLPRCYQAFILAFQGKSSEARDLLRQVRKMETPDRPWNQSAVDTACKIVDLIKLLDKFLIKSMAGDILSVFSFMLELNKLNFTTDTQSLYRTFVIPMPYKQRNALSQIIFAVTVMQSPSKSLPAVKLAESFTASSLCKFTKAAGHVLQAGTLKDRQAMLDGYNSAIQLMEESIYDPNRYWDLSIIAKISAAKLRVGLSVQKELQDQKEINQVTAKRLLIECATDSRLNAEVESHIRQVIATFGTEDSFRIAIEKLLDLPR